MAAIDHGDFVTEWRFAELGEKEFMAIHECHQDIWKL